MKKEIENNIENDKNITETYNLLLKLTENKWEDISYFNGQKVEIYKKPKGYLLVDSIIGSEKSINNSIISTTFGQIIITSTSSYNKNGTIRDNKLTESNTYVINSFKSDKFSKTNNSFYRLIIPVNKKPDFFTSIEVSRIKILCNDILWTTTNCVSIFINEQNYHIYEHHEENNTYLIIDTHNKLTFELFSDTCFSILLSFGFITGTFFQDDKFYFEYEDSGLIIPNSFYFNSYRETISSVTRPISNNTYHPSIPEEFKLKQGDINKISQLQFSTLCKLCLDNIDFRIIILQIIESTRASLITSTFMMAVCIEELSSLLLTDEDIQRELNKDERRFVDSLNKLINEKTQKNKNNKELVDLINSDILNRSSKLSNKKQLLNVYSKLGISLNKREIEVIENRNKLLHGNTPTIKGIKIKNQVDIDKSYLYLYFSLYTLVCSAIMKHIGYDDKIFNQYKFLEESIGFFKTNESYYKDLK